MRAFAVILIILCLASLVGVGYLYMTSDVVVSGTGCVASDAQDQQDTFYALKEALSSGSFTGTVFSNSLPEEASACQFYAYTVRLRNNTFLPIKAVELQITPMEGDLLQIGDLDRHDLAPHATADFHATLLTSKEMHNVREIVVTWYLWGLPFSSRVIYSH